METIPPFVVETTGRPSQRVSNTGPLIFLCPLPEPTVFIGSTLTTVPLKYHFRISVLSSQCDGFLGDSNVNTELKEVNNNL